MRVEAPALMGRYVGADRRSGLVPPCRLAPAHAAALGVPRGSGARAAAVGGTPVGAYVTAHSL